MAGGKRREKEAGISEIEKAASELQFLSENPKKASSDSVKKAMRTLVRGSAQQLGHLGGNRLRSIRGVDLTDLSKFKDAVIDDIV